MPRLGEQLKHERETRNTTLEQIADATGIQLGYLEALEKDEFHALPGRAFGKLYIRAYAEVLGFDPQPLIDNYDREQHLKPESSTERPPPEPARPRRVEAAIAQWRQARMAERNGAEHEAAIEDPLPETMEDEIAQNPGAPAEHDEAVVVASNSEASAPIAHTAVRSNRRAGLPVFALLGALFLGAVGACFLYFRTGVEENTPPLSPPSLPSAEPVPEARPVADAEPPAAPRLTEPVPGAATSPGHLTVPEFGVGRRIVNRRLEGRDERFAPGVVVWFSTRVLGGRRREPIRHVWLHEGVAVQSIELTLGGSNWRTHSSKRLGQAGQWTVEARDQEDRVLATGAFLCVP